MKTTQHFLVFLKGHALKVTTVVVCLNVLVFYNVYLTVFLKTCPQRRFMYTGDIFPPKKGGV